MPLDNFRQIFLPYCIKQNEDGTFSILNREYSDLGEAREAHAPSTPYRLQGLGPAALDKLAVEPSNGSKTWYLYDDGCLPDSSSEAWAAYTKRLWALRKFEMKDFQRDRTEPSKTPR